MTIKVNLNPIKSAATLQYLGRSAAYKNIEWAALYHNLMKAQQMWGMVSRVLVKVGATMQALEMMYKTVVQMVLIYVSESWVITDEMMKVLERFHHQIYRRI